MVNAYIGNFVLQVFSEPTRKIHLGLTAGNV